MLSLAHTAKTFSCKPSSYITGLSGYEAYCLDSACALFLAYWMQDKRPKGYASADETDARTFL